ncbi:hypothetical protein GUITHDRAFT_48468, partial [Guillardia theta CCMP2712]
RILKFSIPALSIPLADPIMSFVDAVCVGQYASTLELAAIGPNLVIFNFINFTFSFLAIATTLSMSAALASQDRKTAGRIVSSSLQLALLSGVAIIAGAVAFSFPLLAATGAVPELLLVAQKYLLIRIWASPAVLATMVLQSGLLAQRDSFTCFLAVLLSAASNIAGDIFLIRFLGLGLEGAAWATLAGNYLALLLLVLLGYTRVGQRMRGTAVERLELGLIAVQACGPLFFVSACKNLCYLMLQSVATSFSTTTCAAHQAMWSVWTILSFCPTPLEQCAQ